MNWFARLIQVENTRKISQPLEGKKLFTNLWKPILTNQGIFSSVLDPTPQYSPKVWRVSITDITYDFDIHVGVEEDVP